MDFFERCKYLNLNPVLLARHFQYRAEVFSEAIVVNGPLGKVKYHAIRVEFQVQGSPHIHSFLWIIDAPVLSKANIDEYIKFNDSVVKLFVPNPAEFSELFHLVTTYQAHSHSKSCRKYKNERCRYNFGKCFTNHAITALPLQEDLPEDLKNSILNEQERILTTVKQYIDCNLDPRRKNIMNPFKEDFEEISLRENLPEDLKNSILNEPSNEPSAFNFIELRRVIVSCINVLK